MGREDTEDREQHDDTSGKTDGPPAEAGMREPKKAPRA
jgi:hypothetical protein